MDEQSIAATLTTESGLNEGYAVEAVQEAKIHWAESILPEVRGPETDEDWESILGTAREFIRLDLLEVIEDHFNNCEDCESTKDALAHEADTSK